MDQPGTIVTDMMKMKPKITEITKKRVEQL